MLEEISRSSLFSTTSPVHSRFDNYIYNVVDNVEITLVLVAI
eukprot:Nitzschia sp. Nitz4//scaffold172_size47551//15185//15401//NITZ4_007142-RA/size47551-exonerate_est2genome-gene-0.29-mRNA-1//1//CDS//3329538753//2186//frame0